MAKRGKAAIATIAGQTDVQSIASVHRDLLNTMQGSDAVVLDVASVSDGDLTLIQLIVAARRYADTSGKSICLSGPVPSKLHECLLRGGFLSNDAEKRFWRAEEEHR
jgi:anti-anti-sigma regulatory factor